MTRMINQGLGRASGRVKTLAILTIYLLIRVAPQAPAEALNSPGEILLRQSLIWLPAYLAKREEDLKYFGKTEKAGLFRRLRKAALAVRELALDPNPAVHEDDLVTYGLPWREPGLVRFLPESSGAFRLPHETHIRDAVTGDAEDSEILFNRDRIAGLAFGDALRLWVHEVGHKVRAADPSVTQEAVDEAAAEIARLFAGQSYWSERGPAGSRLLVTNGVPYTSPVTFQQGFGYLNSRHPSYLVLEAEGRFYDVSAGFDAELDEFRTPYTTHWETVRWIRNVRWLAADEAVLDMETFRFPKNLSRYLQTDLGGPFRKLAHVRFSGGKIEVLTYKEAWPLPQVADDASVSFRDLKVEDGKITGYLDLHVRTERFHHAASYPDHEAYLLVYANGQSLRVPVNVRAIDYRVWGRLPGEIHKQELTKPGRMEAAWPEGAGDELEITGVIDRFFVLGSGWPDFPRDSYKLVTAAEPVKLSRCAGAVGGY